MSVLLWPHYDVCAENGTTIIRVISHAVLARDLTLLKIKVTNGFLAATP